MKVFIGVLFIFMSTSSFAAGGFDCRGEYNKFLKSTRSWGTNAEYRAFMSAQTKQTSRALAQSKFNKSVFLRWKKMLYVKASDLISESYSRMSTPLVNRISSKGEIPKNYIFKFLRDGNRSKSFCSDRMMDFNEIAFSIILSYDENK